MSSFRVTKYDPANRDSNGHYLVDDWTSVSDIGNGFSTGLLSVEEYLRVESTYVATIQQLMTSVNVKSVQVEELERYDTLGHLPKELQLSSGQDAGALSAPMRLAVPDVGRAIRAVLRETAWCKLRGESGFYVHFGYDFYMYVGGDLVVGKISLPEGMFAEQMESPYE